MVADDEQQLAVDLVGPALDHAGREQEEGGGKRDQQDEDGENPATHQRVSLSVLRATVTKLSAGRPASSAGWSSRATSRHSAGSGAAVAVSERKSVVWGKG